MKHGGNRPTNGCYEASELGAHGGRGVLAWEMDRDDSKLMKER